MIPGREKDDFAPGGANDEMHGPAGGEQHVQEADAVGGAAGAGNGQDEITGCHARKVSRAVAGPRRSPSGG